MKTPSFHSWGEHRRNPKEMAYAWSNEVYPDTIRVEAIASRLEAIALRLEAIATRVEAIANRFLLLGWRSDEVDNLKFIRFGSHFSCGSLRSRPQLADLFPHEIESFCALHFEIVPVGSPCSGLRQIHPKDTWGGIYDISGASGFSFPQHRLTWCLCRGAMSDLGCSVGKAHAAVIAGAQKMGV